MLHRHLAGHIEGSPSGGRSRARSGWTRDAQSRSRSSGWRFRLVQAGPSRPLGGSKTARHTAPRRGLGLPLPSRSRPLPRPPTRHVPESPAPCDLLPLAWPIFRPVPSTSLARPAREWHYAVYLRALPRQRLRHAESASSRFHVAERPRLSGRHWTRHCQGPHLCRSAPAAWETVHHGSRQTTWGMLSYL